MRTSTFSYGSRASRLHDLTTERYSRAALPLEFQYANCPANTTRGQIQWGDALYFRDLADPDYAAKHGWTGMPGEACKLAVLFEHFGLPDCAAETIARRSEFESLNGGGVDIWLDALVPERGGAQSSYAEHIARFENDPGSFLPEIGGGGSPVRSVARECEGAADPVAGRMKKLRRKLRQKTKVAAGR